jgi:signal transduction histidine kinase
VQVDVLHRDGRPRSVVVSGGPVRDEVGNLTGALLVVRDITGELEAARLKDEFLATASHELQTPIASVKGLAEVLLLTLRRQGNVAPEQLEERLSAIVREADRLALLGRDLLDASRAQSGKMRLALTPVDLNDVAAAAIARHRTILADQTTRHALVLSPAESPVPVLADRARLDQVLDNLLDNAVKYSPAGGQVAVAVATRGSAYPPRISHACSRRSSAPPMRRPGTIRGSASGCI